MYSGKQILLFRVKDCGFGVDGSGPNLALGIALALVGEVDELGRLARPLCRPEGLPRYIILYTIIDIIYFFKLKTA